jgi:GAF domain-containing protein
LANQVARVEKPARATVHFTVYRRRVSMHGSTAALSTTIGLGARSRTGDNLSAQGETRSLHNQSNVLGAVDAVLQFADEALHYDHASVLLMRRKHAQTFAATDELITTADQLQIDLGEGPSLQAIADHDDVLVEDTAADTRWPQWAPTAAANGIRSVLAIRLFTTHATSEALNLISSQPFVFNDRDREAAHLLALHASIGICSARMETSLRQAVDSGKEVGQAVGRLMERYGLDAVQAFDVLRRYSQSRNERLREVAHHVIDSGDLPTAPSTQARGTWDGAP